MSFKDVVTRIRDETGLVDEVPNFDSLNGNENARYLFLLEAPGPKAVASGVVSFENNDPTARNFRTQLARADIDRSEIAIWNIVPWYIGVDNEKKKIRASKKADIEEGIKYLPYVLELMDNLTIIVLAGSAARKAHVSLSCLTTARILSCHHTSAQSMNSNPQAEEDNIRVFSHMKLIASNGKI